jgi:hypothetical protein
MLVPLLLAVSLFAAPAPARPKPPANPRPEGPAFAVSGCKDCSQLEGHLAGIAPGTFTVLWSDWTSTPKALFRTFDLKRKGGPERGFEVSPTRSLGVSALDRGFVLGWRQQPANLFVRGLDAAGNPSGDPIHLNPGHPTTVDEDNPDLAAARDGRFLAVWDRRPFDLSTGPVQIMARSGDLGGGLGPEVVLGTAAYPVSPIACRAPSGEGVVAWMQRNQRATGAAGEIPPPTGLSLRRLAADGSPTGGVVEVLAPEESTWSLGIVLACSPGGGFALAWHTRRSPAAEGADTFLQRFDAAGERVGETLRVHAGTAGDQTDPALLLEAGGRLLVAWRSDVNGTREVRGRRFAATGQPVGKEFVLVKGKPGADLGGPALAPVGESGRFVVLWREGTTYFARIFRP